RLEVDQDIRVDLPMLPPTAKNATASVTATPSPLRRESSGVGAVIDERMVLGLPLDGRNFYQLSLLLPGVVPPAQGSAGSVRGDFAINVNGAREDSNNFLLDGAYNGDPKLNGVALTSPVDAIREFEVAESTYDSSFGRNAGAQINVVTRSGGNAFHGTGYEFFRNGAMDAQNYFAPKDQPAPRYQRNQFGATLGGPVRKNKTFFFTDYEGTRLNAGQTLITNVPTALERKGDFSQSPGLYAIDPTSGSVLPGNALPTFFQNPIGQKIANLYPLPNRSTPGANYVSSPIETQDDNHFDGRVDQVIGAKDNLAARYSFVDGTFFSPFNGFSSLPGYGLNIPRRAQNIALSETHIFSPSLLNELRLAYNRVANNTIQQNAGTSINHQVGLPELSTNPRDWGLSEISINGFSPLGNENTSPQRGTTNTYQINDSATWNHGTHLVKFGFDQRILQQNAFRDVEARGFINFTGALIGNPLEELLLGAPTLTGGATMDNPQHLRTHSSDFFVQDSWRLRPNLTVNLGLRYEYNAPGVDAQDRANVFDPLQGKIVPVGQSGFPRSGYNADLNNLAPQLGIAYSKGSTVFRAAYGIHYDTSSLAISEGLYFSAPYFNLRVAFDYPGLPPLSLADPFPANFPIPIPSSATAFQRGLRTPYIQQWNFGIQQQLGASRVFEVAYVGSKGTHLIDSRDINQPAPSNSPQLIRPNPYYSDVDIIESQANSVYHSLQARFQQRLSNGLSLLASYTFAKSIDDASAFFSSAGDSNFPQNSNNLSAERGLSNFDIRHRVTLSYAYDIPLAKGHRYLGGWQSFGVLTFQSGQPFTVLLLRDLDNSNTGQTTILGGSNDRPNVIANPNLSDPTPQKWFNTSAFVISPRGTFGNAGRNIVEGPGLATVNFSIVKNTQILERLNMQFRAEFFNLLNRTNFDLPDNFVGSPTFGQVVSAEDPRRLQLALKFLF
ncbi:MAG: hypothetical protein LAO79_21990, partial [Acidobacteriia bacterium]|nr:hypothetical protein [Terriglobia bacterium]